jgi:hypothetical protein
MKIRKSVYAGLFGREIRPVYDGFWLHRQLTANVHQTTPRCQTRRISE